MAGVEAEVLAGAWEVPRRRIRWRTAIRIIPSRFPPIDLFERVADPEDFEALHEVEALTNDRLREEVGDIRRVAPEDRVFGPGSSWIMAPFTHPNPNGSRFSDGAFGVYYAARDRATAVAETCYHRARFLAWTGEPPIELDVRVLEATLDARLHDLHPLAPDLPGVLDPDDYGAGQRLGGRLREEGSWGIAYPSVRRAGGDCVAVFRPRALSGCRQAEHLVYAWDGTEIAEVYEKKRYRP